MLASFLVDCIETSTEQQAEIILVAEQGGDKCVVFAGCRIVWRLGSAVSDAQTRIPTICTLQPSILHTTTMKMMSSTHFSPVCGPECLCICLVRLETQRFPSKPSGVDVRASQQGEKVVRPGPEV